MSATLKNEAAAANRTANASNANGSTTPGRFSRPIVLALREMKEQNQQWDPENNPPTTWWNAVDSCITLICEANANATLADHELSLCEPIANMIDGRFEMDNDGEQKAGASRDLTAAIGELLAAEPRQWPELESIQTLEKQHVRHSQIAMMHGLTVGQVERILDGEEKYPANHTTPHVRDQIRARRLLRERLKLAFNRYNSLIALEGYRTVEDMIDDEMELGEIADEMGVEEDSIIAEADRRGFELPIDDDMSDEEKVYSLADQGIANSEIADTLGLAVQRVGSILRNRVASEEAAKALADKQSKSKLAAKVNRVKRGPGRPRKDAQE